MVIGNFDGVHRGHQAVLREAAADAEARGLDLLILTFHPHPAKVLRRTEPPVLTVLPRKLELMERVVPGAGVAVETFDLAWAAQSPAEFAERILVQRFDARVVVVGKNFRFGKDRAGDFGDLTRLGEQLGFETRSHPMVGDERGPWSSSRVRDAIADAYEKAGKTIESRDEEPPAEAEFQFTTATEEGSVQVTPLCQGRVTVRWRIGPK